MKRYIRSDIDSYVEYDSIFDWYESDEGDDDNVRFAQMLEGLVKQAFDVSDYFEEPSTQLLSGADFIDIELADGHKYSFEFSWEDMQTAIFEDGPEAAAKHYFNKIKEGIESGSALASTD